MASVQLRMPPRSGYSRKSLQRSKIISANLLKTVSDELTVIMEKCNDTEEKQKGGPDVVDTTITETNQGTPNLPTKEDMSSEQQTGTNAQMPVPRVSPEESPVAAPGNSVQSPSTDGSQVSQPIVSSPDSISLLSDDVFVDSKQQGEKQGVDEAQRVEEPGELTRSGSLSSHTSLLSSATLNDEESSTALISMARNFDLKAVEEILKDPSINVNQTTGKGCTCAHEMVKAYIDMDIVAQMTNRPKILKLLTLLCGKGLDMNAKDTTKKRQTALHRLAESPGHSDVMKTFMAAGSRVNLQDSGGNTSLHKAITKGNAENCEVLLEGGADPNIHNVSGQTPLHLACKVKRSLVIVQLLVKCGASLDERDLGGRTPLHVAAKAGRSDLVRELLIAGADVNDIDISGQSAVHIATANDITGNALRELIDRPSANLNLQDTVYMETALHKAVRLNMMENLKLLARQSHKRIRVNVRDNLGETPLHKAAVNCEIVHVWKLLLGLNGNVNLINDAQLTPYQKALKSKNHVAIAMMKQICEVD